MEPIIASTEPARQGLQLALLLLQSAAFIAAVAIILRMAVEKRTPSNIFAWSLLLIFLPLLGVPLYLLFGGRKVRRLVRKKLEIQRLAMRAARQSGLPSEGVEDGGGCFEGNRVTLLPDGVEAYNTLCDEIERAQESIHITTYILGGDGIARDIVRRLAAAARRGVTVRLLIDALGSLGHGGRFCEPLRRAGGEVARFIPLLPLSTGTSANLRNHRKIAIFDNSRAIVGGQNIDGRFLGTHNHPRLFTDLSVLVEGPALAPLIRAFVGDWIFASGQDVQQFRSCFGKSQEAAGDSTLEIIASGPDVDGDPLYERIVTLVQELRRELTIITPYFIPDEVILRSLIIKAHAGRRVRIIIPESSNHRIVDLARNHFLRQLNSEGVEVLFYRKRMMHAKLLLVDGEVALTGSANIDPRSLFVNFEIGVVHRSKGDVDMLESWVREQLLPHCVRYKENRRSRTSRTRLFAENLAHLLTPLL